MKGGRIKDLTAPDLLAPGSTVSRAWRQEAGRMLSEPLTQSEVQHHPVQLVLPEQQPACSLVLVQTHRPQGLLKAEGCIFPHINLKKKSAPFVRSVKNYTLKIPEGSQEGRSPLAFGLTPLSQANPGPRREARRPRHVATSRPGPAIPAPGGAPSGTGPSPGAEASPCCLPKAVYISQVFLCTPDIFASFASPWGSCESTSTNAKGHGHTARHPCP